MLKSAGFPCQNISASVRWDICREQFFLKYSSLLMTSRLKEVFDYAENPDKTIDKKYVDSDLFAALQYAADDKKTDERMTATKKRFGKTGGNVAYHGYQSFQTGRKFENHISDHYRLREISDAISLEHGKSILKDATFTAVKRKLFLFLTILLPDKMC